MAEDTRALTSPTLLPERCTGCGLCVAACPCGGVQLGEANRPVFSCERSCTREANCVACRAGFHPCQVVCDAGAIRFPFTIGCQREKG